MTAKVIILKRKFEGTPTLDNFKIVEEKLRPLQQGEFLVEARYISVDPYQRVYPPKVGQTMLSEQVAKVIESQNNDFPVGSSVVGEWGWRTHTIAKDVAGDFCLRKPRLLTGYDGLSRSLALSVLGMPGNAAYFGLLHMGKPMKGNTVVVSSAAGGVGTIVGQIAKIKGCKAVGITSSVEKGERLVKEVGYDHYVSYNSKNFEKDLSKATKDTVHCYFDSVGGEISSSVLTKMKKFGRVVICGAISTYNSKIKATASEVQTTVKVQHLVMEGFKVTRFKDQWDEGIQQNLQWLKEGRLKPFEHIVDGFSNTPNAFIGMFAGQNFGKTIVRVG
ncbi:prostaglandin reductase 1-like [Zophobas morio]|uniref:prostaglandin reductase 1-like n=1 Tax=Zophobas morio TaxID=2755281 RepID=UPI003083C399